MPPKGRVATRMNKGPIKGVGTAGRALKKMIPELQSETSILWIGLCVSTYGIAILLFDSSSIRQGAPIQIWNADFRFSYAETSFKQRNVEFLNNVLCQLFRLMYSLVVPSCGTLIEFHSLDPTYLPP